jgi:hypothetical protein
VASSPETTPPDPNAALAQYVQQAVASLDAVEVGLGADPALTPAQKRHAAKLRKGGAAILAQIGNLAQQQQLESPALNVSDMTAALDRAEALQPLANRVAAFAKHIADVIFTSQNDAVVKGSQLYALLQRRTGADAELATAMQPITAFFAYRHKTTKPLGTPTKPQQKATAKAVKTLQKNAPQMLQSTPAATGQQTAATAVAPTAGAGAVVPTGNGAAGPAAPTGATHS